MTMPTDPTQQVPTVVPSAPTPPAPVPTPPRAPQAPEPQYFTQADIDAAREQARREANDRLYGRIESSDQRYAALQQQVDELRAANEKALEDERKRAEQIQADADAARREDMTAKQILEEESAKWNDRFTQMQRDIETRDALLDQERKRSELNDYKNRRIAEEKDPKTDAQGQRVSDGIAPQLIGYVDGNSPEEIEQAIVTAKQNTTSILESIRQSRAQQAALAPGVPVNSGTPNFDSMGQQQEFSADEIRAMSMNDPRLLALREQHGLGRATTNQGMFH